MRAAVIDAPYSVRVVEVPAPASGPQDVLVRIAYLGLCGTDLELLHGTSPYLRDGRARHPHIFGHEWVGVVEAVGSGVTAIARGEVVTGSTMLCCQQCPSCAAGRRNRCRRLREVGLYDHPGAAAEFLSVPSNAVASFGPCTPLPAHVLVEPMVTVLEGLDAACVRPGDRVLVIGAGTIGSLAVLLLASPTIAVDVVEPRPVEHLDPAIYRHHHTMPQGVDYDVVVEASGAPGALRDAISALRPGGACVLVGVALEPEAINIGAVALAGIRIIGVRHGIDHYGRGVALFATLAGALDRLVERVVPLECVAEAFDLLEGPRTRPKVVISVG